VFDITVVPVFPCLSKSWDSARSLQSKRVFLRLFVLHLLPATAFSRMCCRAKHPLPAATDAAFLFPRTSNMAIQSSNGSRNQCAATGKGMASKVASKSGKPAIGKKVAQPLVGKLGSGMASMPGGKDAVKGGAVKTVESQKITGKIGRGMTAMGGALIDGKV
jgi:hypothetical protein